MLTITGSTSPLLSGPSTSMLALGEQACRGPVKQRNARRRDADLGEFLDMVLDRGFVAGSPSGNHELGARISNGLRTGFGVAGKLQHFVLDRLADSSRSEAACKSAFRRVRVKRCSAPDGFPAAEREHQDRSHQFDGGDNIEPRRRGTGQAGR